MEERKALWTSRGRREEEAAQMQDTVVGGSVEHAADFCQ
jgi:hypothetical protein